MAESGDARSRTVFTASMAVLVVIAAATAAFALWYLGDVRGKIDAPGAPGEPAAGSAAEKQLDVVLTRAGEATRVTLGGAELGPVADPTVRTEAVRRTQEWVRAHRPRADDWLAVAVVDSDPAVPLADSVAVGNLLIGAGIHSIQFTAPLE